MKASIYLNILKRYKKDLSKLYKFVSLNREHLTAEQMILPYRVLKKMIQNDYVSTVEYGKHLPQIGTVNLSGDRVQRTANQTLFQDADSAFVHVNLAKPVYRSTYTVSIQKHQASVSFKAVNTNGLPKLAAYSKVDEKTSRSTTDKTVRDVFLSYIDLVIDWLGKRIRLYMQTHQRFFNRLRHVKREEAAVRGGHHSFLSIFGKSPEYYLNHN